MKYVVWPEWDHEQLFDLGKEPTETQNLVDHRDYAATLAAMRRKMADWHQRAQ